MTKQIDFRATSFNAHSDRELHVHSLSSIKDAVGFRIEGRNDGGTAARFGRVNLDNQDTINLAVELLRVLAPDRLAPKPEPTFSETPVGTFLRNRGTGQVVKVVAYDERFEGYSPAKDCLWAEQADGDIMVPWQDSRSTTYNWDVVQGVEKKVFEVIG